MAAINGSTVRSSFNSPSANAAFFRACILGSSTREQRVDGERANSRQRDRSFLARGILVVLKRAVAPPAAFNNPYTCFVAQQADQMRYGGRGVLAHLSKLACGSGALDGVRRFQRFDQSGQIGLGRPAGDWLRQTRLRES